MSNIYTAISNVMAEIGAIPKDKQGNGFKYRGIDDVMDALHPILSKNKVFIVPEVIDQSREEKQSKSGGALNYSICKIKYTFYADDGSNISATVIGEAMDSGDKATNKSMAIAFKYACFQVFCIPLEDDPDKDSHELKGKKPEAQQQQASTNNLISEAQVKRLYTIGKGKEDLAKSVIKKYGYESSKLINKKDYEAICKEIEKGA